MRRSDLRMREVIQDLFLYAIFLWVIYSLSFDNRDPHAFEQSQQLNKLFKVTNEFKQVSDSFLLWYRRTIDMRAYIVVGNGHGDTSSNTGRDWLHFP